MKDGSVCLIIVFGCRYEENIGRLRRLYGARFSAMYCLVPFYCGNEPGVIPVHHGSFCYQGSFAEACHRFYDEHFTHYVFIADDLLLNPRFNQANILGEYGLDETASYIKRLMPLTDESTDWSHFEGAVQALETWRGVEYRKELPPREVALAKMKALGIELKRLTWRHFFPPWRERERPPGFKARCHRALFKMRYPSGKDLAYPLLKSYADFLIVAGKDVRHFCRLCGVFSAMGVFVEVAVPTALALSCGRILREDDVPWKGREIWEPRERKTFEEAHQRKLQNLFVNGEKIAYFHPVKLSKWS